MPFSGGIGRKRSRTGDLRKKWTLQAFAASKGTKGDDFHVKASGEAMARKVLKCSMMEKHEEIYCLK